MQTAVIPPGLVHARESSYSIPEYEYVALTFLGSYRCEATRRNYADALKAWFAWMEERNVDPLHEAKRAHIEFWQRWMEDIRHYAPRTICGRLNALSGYYKTAVMDGHIESSPMQFVRRPRVDRVSTSTYLTRSELVAVINLAERAQEWRDMAALCLLGLNGLRASELVGIDIEDLGRDRGYRTITIRGKGGYIDKIPLAPRTMWAVETLIGDRTNGPLFRSKRTPDKRMTRADLQAMVKRYAKKAGICKPIHPHSFRHSYVTLSLDAGVSHRAVQGGARHRDPRSTAYYDRNRNSLHNDPTHRLSAFVEGAI